MKCPTCEKAVEGKCCQCGKDIPADAQKLAPDPYAWEIDGDESKHLECDECADNSAMEV